MNDSHPDLRASFPGLRASTEALLDNAGGSQVPDSVIEALTGHMREDYVQLGADYERSRRATAKVERAHRVAGTLVNAGESGVAILGKSTSTLCATLADAYRRAHRGESPVVVVGEAGHEANIAPWLRLADDGWEVRLWRAREDGESRLEDLEELLDDRVRLVAMHHVSNLLGGIEDVAGVVRLAHGVDARVIVDGVAYAPHRAVDVQALGADWYVFSTYKVYGPHLAVMYGTHAALADVEGPNHHFVPAEDIAYKWELGGVPHEGCAALVGLEEYLATVAGEGTGRGEELTRATVEAAFGRMAALEAPLQERLVSWVKQHPRLRLIGPASTGADRVATVSFVHRERKSADIARAANEAGLCIRYGHFYSERLCVRLGLDPEDGVVRTSAVHYNTAEEIERLIKFFERML